MIFQKYLKLVIMEKLVTNTGSFDYRGDNYRIPNYKGYDSFMFKNSNKFIPLEEGTWSVVGALYEIK